MIDRINLDILRCLRINARCKASDISQKVNLSVSAVIERIRRMEASGIIRQYTVLIDPTQVGNDLTALMEVSLEHPKYYDDLVDMIRQHPNVAECHYLTGEFDFLLKIVTDSSSSLEQIHRNIKSMPGVSSTKTHFVLKTMTLNNEKQKINDLLGNPIIIGIAVIWRVADTAKAVFEVDNYQEFLSIQCDSALRNIVRLYPYDVADDGSDEKSLRGSAQEIAENLKQEIAARVAPAGLEILEARITHLAYAPEIAAVMLQRQQASAVIDARKMIVDGAVGMVEMALDKLNERQIVELDEERKAQMVSNLMIVLCSSKDAQPVVNSGSLY